MSDTPGEGVGAPLRLEPLPVRTEADAVAAFAREIGTQASRVPFTFPIRWLAHPEIRAAAARIMGESGWIPLHESQSFDYRSALVVDADYRMQVEMRREARPPRLVVRSEVAAPDGGLCLTMETILRIVAPDGNEALDLPRQ